MEPSVDSSRHIENRNKKYAETVLVTLDRLEELGASPDSALVDFSLDEIRSIAHRRLEKMREGKPTQSFAVCSIFLNSFVSMIRNDASLRMLMRTMVELCAICDRQLLEELNA